MKGLMAVPCDVVSNDTFNCTTPVASTNAVRNHVHMEQTKQIRKYVMPELLLVLLLHYVHLDDRDRVDKDKSTPHHHTENRRALY
jgi:hypothetical protein